MTKLNINNNNNSNNNLKRIFETVCFYNNELKRLENQFFILKFLKNFYSSKINKIGKKLNKFEFKLSKYENIINNNDFNANLKGLKNEIKELNLDNIDFNFVSLEKAYENFKKMNFIFKQRINILSDNYKTFSNREANWNLDKLSNEKIQLLNNLNPIYADIIKGNDIFKDKIFIKDIYIESLKKIESFWIQNNYNSYIEHINQLFKLRVN